MTVCDAKNGAGMSCARPAKFQVRGGPTLVNSCGVHLSSYTAEFIEQWGAVTTRPTPEVVTAQKRARAEAYARMVVAEEMLDQGDDPAASPELYERLVAEGREVYLRALFGGADPEAAVSEWWPARSVR